MPGLAGTFIPLVLTVLGSWLVMLYELPLLIQTSQGMRNPCCYRPQLAMVVPFSVPDAETDCP